jgi:hypothetical protein
MVLKFGQSREDVADLIARKQYTKAIDVIKVQLTAQKNDDRIRLQLADVLVQAGRPPEAVALLVQLADEYARDGFAAKAIAVLKRIQKIDPRRSDVEARLAALIEAKQKQATVPIALSPARVEFGFEEIQPGLELGIEPIEDGPELSIAPAAQEESRPRPKAAVVPAPVEDHDLAFGNAEALDLAPDEPVTEAEVQVEPEIHAEPEVLAEVEPEVHTEPEIVLEPEPEALPLVEADLDPMGDELFAQELLSVLEGAFPTTPQPDVPPPAASADATAAGGGRQIVVSPLFRDFSLDELVAVIQGLKLLSYEAGEIIISEGEPGESLYMLSLGRVKAFKRSPAGKQALLGEMSEGAFFGEISVLTGKPRSATVVAATPCELLELDRPTLDEITRTHPHVWDVLREYADRRTKGQR